MPSSYLDPNQWSDILTHIITTEKYKVQHPSMLTFFLHKIQSVKSLKWLILENNLYNSGIRQVLSTRDTTIFPQNRPFWLLLNVTGKFEQNQKHTEPSPSCQPYYLFEEKPLTLVYLSALMPRWCGHK